MIKLFEDFINEAKQPKVVKKDFDRMLKLVLTGNDGIKVTKTLKDKNKAIQRYVAGLKLSGATEIPLSKYGWYYGPFKEFAERGKELGATDDDIENLFNITEVPQTYFDEIAKKSSKNLKTYAGPVSQAVLDAGYDIEYQPHNGRAITTEGRQAMNNGRKWTIGYKSIIDLGDKKVNFDFDAITDEGGGPTYFIKAYSSDPMFNKLSEWNSVGVREFIKNFKEILQSA